MSLTYLYVAVSWVLLRWHDVITTFGMSADSGANWALSIVFLVVTARLLLVRVVLNQVRYQRRMQSLQPAITSLRATYRTDKARLHRELSALHQAEGLTPLSGLLPLALQLPVFLGLLHVLRHLAAAASPAYQAAHPARLSLYGFSRAQTLSFAKAKVFGGAPLSGRLFDTPDQLGGSLMTTQAVIIGVVLLSAAATYLTQRLVIAGQGAEPDATVARVQRLSRWLVPLSTLGSALFFPLGVLFYWLASNSWTAAQQLYLTRSYARSQASTQHSDERYGGGHG